MKAWTNLEHLVYTQIKQNHLLNDKMRVCVSGGLDSMVLYEILNRILPPEQLEVFHFHHGVTSNLEFRNQAQKTVQEKVSLNGHRLIVRQAKERLNSEAELRRGRRQSLKELQIEEPAVIVWAHHQDDLLETRLLRLIRGTGSQGINAMRIWSSPHFRPLLQVSRREIAKYAMDQHVSFIEDPSNLSTKYLRNWVRHRWLRELEKRSPGSVQVLAQSLENIVETLDAKNSSSEALGVTARGLDRRIYETLSVSERGRAIAFLFFHSEVRDFKASQIKEIQKRLDKGQNELTFRIAGIEINVNAERIWIQR